MWFGLEEYFSSEEQKRLEKFFILLYTEVEKISSAKPLYLRVLATPP